MVAITTGRVGGKRLALAVAIVLVGGLAEAAHIVSERRDTDAVTVVLGSDPAVLGRRLFETKAGLGIRLNAAEYEALKGRMESSPLDGNAFAMAGLYATAHDDRRSAAALIDHALALDPRTRLAWLWRLDDDSRAGRNVQAASSVLRLLAVDPAQYPVYVPMLAALSRDQRNIAQIATALRGNPGWRVPFLDLLQNGGFDPAIRYALMDGEGAKIFTANTEQTSFLSDLIAKGDYERAYLAWISYLPDAALGGVDTPYDAKFAGLPGSPPFNWQFSSENGDRADPGESGLEVSYSGRQPATLASQVVVLPPGGYRLRSVLTSAGSEGGPNGGTALTWKVQCLPSRTDVNTLPLNLERKGVAQVSAPFQIADQGCTAVNLSLIGTASEFPTRLNAKIGMVRLEKTSDGQVPGSGPLPVAVPSPTVLP